MLRMDTMSAISILSMGGGQGGSKGILSKGHLPCEIGPSLRGVKGIASGFKTGPSSLVLIVCVFSLSVGSITVTVGLILSSIPASVESSSSDSLPLVSESQDSGSVSWCAGVLSNIKPSRSWEIFATVNS